MYVYMYITGKGVVSSITPWCSSYEKGVFGLPMCIYLYDPQKSTSFLGGYRKYFSMFW